MRVGVHHPAPQQQPFPPAVHLPGSSSGLSASSDLYSVLSSEMWEHRAQLSSEIQEHHTQISAEITAQRQQLSEEMSARYQGLQNDMGYFCDSI